MSPAPRVDVGELADGVREGRRASVSRAITLVESSRPDHRAAARELLAELTPGAGVGSPAVRVGISGVPGVGKSTFIESLGTHLTGRGHRVGVLAVDPSSVRTGGSVLGDKTRMARLAVDPQAYIRPSPSAGTLGGVARATSQAMTVLEAAGHDVVLVETVGVGQSEITVSRMVDTFLFLTIARTGDQLQGIKKGILEIADVVAVNKADEDREGEARVAARELAGALRLVRGHAEWAPPVVTCSGLTGRASRRSGSGCCRTASTWRPRAWRRSGPSSSWSSPGRWSGRSSSTGSPARRACARSGTRCARRCSPGGSARRRHPTGSWRPGRTTEQAPGPACTTR